ncbi:hypothetical protein Bbelb_153990 [Branchiostoma belcheri]|nr:hypothetical protein Bbelb_153990 [Branchiostoma belcheri]
MNSDLVLHVGYPESKLQGSVAVTRRQEASPSGSPLDPARDLAAARPNCKSRSAPYHTPHGSRRETGRAPDGSLTETGRQGDQNTTRPRQGAVKEHLIVTLTGRRTLGVMTPAGVYAEDIPNGRRFKCDLSITTFADTLS